MIKKDRRQNDSEWKDCERVDGKEGKININTHLDGWQENGENMNKEYVKEYGEWIEQVAVQVHGMEECFWKMKWKSLEA